jgi:hypothetical protein
MPTHRKPKTQPASDTTDLHRRARELLRSLDHRVSHCIRRVAFCELIRTDYRDKLDTATAAWTRGVDTWHPVGRDVYDACRAMGLVEWDGGSVLTELGHEVARLIAAGLGLGRSEGGGT